MIVRHKLLADLVRLWKNDELVEKIDRLPIELSPRKSKPLGRCCVHKERAVWRYKTFPLMGLDMTDEHDEVTPLSEYARLALSRPEPDKENIRNYQSLPGMRGTQLLHELPQRCDTFQEKRSGND